MTTARKPRVITTTVTRLRALAARLASIFPAGRIENQEISDAVTELRDVSAVLDSYDARETKLDPSKRRKAKATR